MVEQHSIDCPSAPCQRHASLLAHATHLHGEHQCHRQLGLAIHNDVTWMRLYPSSLLQDELLWDVLAVSTPIVPVWIEKFRAFSTIFWVLLRDI